MLSNITFGEARFWRTGILTAGLLFLTACQSFDRPVAPDEGINYRAQRYEEISAMRDYRDCIAQAVLLDTQARQSNEPAQYLASAKLIEKCEAEIGSEVSEIGEEERMRNYALATLNYARGGDVAQSRRSLQTLEKSFPNLDIYLRNGTSFIDTIGVLISRNEGSDFGEFSTLNVSRELKNEMRRVTYWSSN